MAGQRMGRLREEIKKEAADIIRMMKDPRVGFATVTDVEVSGDLRHVKIFVSVYGSEEEKAETMKALEGAAGHVRSELGARIRLRYTPEVHFKFDESLERGARIFKILQDVGRGNGESS